MKGKKKQQAEPDLSGAFSPPVGRQEILARLKTDLDPSLPNGRTESLVVCTADELAVASNPWTSLEQDLVLL